MNIKDMPSPHMDVWNNLVAVLLLPGLDQVKYATALDFLTRLNNAKRSGESIPVAYEALQWLNSHFK